MKNITIGQEVIFKDKKGVVRCSKVLHVDGKNYTIHNPLKTKKNFKVDSSSIIGVQSVIWNFL